MASESDVGTFDQLTAREQEVLELLRLGLTDAEIAQRLGISAGGASYHVSEIIGKLGVRNRYEAAAWPERPPWWATCLGSESAWAIATKDTGNGGAMVCMW